MNLPVTEPTVALHPLMQRLVQETSAAVLQSDEVAGWLQEPGLAMLVFAEDPERFKETLDIAIIVPELHAAAARGFRVGLLPPGRTRRGTALRICTLARFCDAA
jgi:hydrogenase-1 operon protein HyaE